jgi:signal transduction histidine kinase
VSSPAGPEEELLRRAEEAARAKIAHGTSKHVLRLVGEWERLIQDGRATGHVDAGKVEDLRPLLARLGAAVGASSPGAFIVPEIQEIDLEAELRDVVADFLEQTDRLQVAVLDAPSTALSTDPAAIHQILGAFVSNALEYSDGPVIVTLRTANEHVVFDVIDSGIGVAEEDREVIWEDGKRGSRTAD